MYADDYTSLPNMWAACNFW